MDNNWFAIMTRPCAEQVARDDLRRRGFEVFWPYVSQWVGHKARTHLVKKAWLSCYLFVKTTKDRLGEAQDERARSMGVSIVVRATNNEPYPIPEAAMRILIDQTDHLGEVHVASAVLKKSTLSLGQVVRFIDERSPLFGFLAEVKKVFDNDTAILHMFTHSLLGLNEITITSASGIELVAGRHTKEAKVTASSA